MLYTSSQYICANFSFKWYCRIFTINFCIFFIVKEIFICRKKLNSGKEYDKFEISKAVAISAIFVNIWPLIPSGNFFNNWLSMFYFYPIGFYLYFKFKNEKNKLAQSGLF